VTSKVRVWLYVLVISVVTLLVLATTCLSVAGFGFFPLGLGVINALELWNNPGKPQLCYVVATLLIAPCKIAALSTIVTYKVLKYVVLCRVRQWNM
jgi:hypothetical protein